MEITKYCNCENVYGIKTALKLLNCVSFEEVVLALNN